MCPKLSSVICSPTLSSYIFQWCHRWLLHLTALTVVHYVLFSFRIEGRQATRIQNNSKDQFEIDLIMLLTPFILICSLDHYWPSCEFWSQQSSNYWRNKTEALLGPLHATGWCRIMLLKNSTIKTNPRKIVENWLKLHTASSLGPLAKVETHNR